MMTIELKVNKFKFKIELKTVAYRMPAGYANI